MPIPCWYVPEDRSKVVRQTTEARRFGRVICNEPTTEVRTITDKQGDQVQVEFTKDEPLP